MGRSSVEAVSDHSSDDLHQLTQSHRTEQVGTGVLKLSEVVSHRPVRSCRTPPQEMTTTRATRSAAKETWEAKRAMMETQPACVTLATRTMSSDMLWTDWSKTSSARSCPPHVTCATKKFAKTSPKVFMPECAAFFGRGQARQHGVQVERTVHNFRRESELEVRTCREREDLTKKSSICRSCGGRGHMAEDKVCLHNPGNSPAHGHATTPSTVSFRLGSSKGKD